MAYSFQTFVSSQLFTATEANQIESNIKDHIHGANNVSASYQAIYGQSIVVASRLSIGGNYNGIAFNTRSSNETIVLMSAAFNQASFRRNQYIFSNVNSEAQQSLIFTSSSLNSGIDYGVNFADSQYFKAIPKGLEIGYANNVVSHTNAYIPCLQMAYQSGSLSNIGYMSANSGLAIITNYTGIYLEDKIYLGCDKSIIFKSGENPLLNMFNVTLTRGKIYSARRTTTSNSYGIVLNKSFPNYEQVKINNSELGANPFQVNSYLFTRGNYLSFQSQSLTYTSTDYAINEGDYFEVYYNINGTCSSGVKSEIHFGFGVSGYRQYFSPLNQTLANSRAGRSGGIIDFFSTMVDSGDRFGASGSVIIRCNSYPGTSTVFTGINVTANSCGLDFYIESNDCFHIYVVN